MKALCLALGLMLVVGCSKDDDDDNNDVGTDTGNTCEVVDDCYPGVEADDLSGPVVCLDRVPNGYCTHECETDEDCCAADGECEEGSPPQVCAPFESENRKMCFLSCEGEDENYCQDELSGDFTCSSTGGGAENRKVCSPKE